MTIASRRPAVPGQRMPRRHMPATYSGCATRPGSQAYLFGRSAARLGWHAEAVSKEVPCPPPGRDSQRHAEEQGGDGEGSRLSPHGGQHLPAREA